MEEDKPQENTEQETTDQLKDNRIKRFHTHPNLETLNRERWQP